MAGLIPLDIGIVMGLVMVWPVLALAIAYRLFSFPDLTVEGSFALGAAAFAAATETGWPLWGAIAAAILAGAALGSFTAAIHAWLGINKFLAGIIVVAMSYTLCLRVMASPNIGLLNGASILEPAAPLDNAYPGLQLGTGLLLLALIVIVIAGLRLAARSKIGLRVRTVGSNPHYGSSIGLGTCAYLVGGLALTNALAATGGAILAMYQGFADVGMGQGALILALASLTIGERLVPGRRLAIPDFVLVAAVAGGIVYQVISAYALYFGLAATDLKFATALFVLAIVAVQIRRHEADALEESV